MEKITFKAYKKVLLDYYNDTKSEDVSGVLLEPSPAQLRDLCCIKIDNGLTKSDEELLRLFFETKREDSLKLSVKRCNIDKLKPIISFLKRESDTENRARVELAAILIGYTPRPYAAFSGLIKNSEVFTAQPFETADQTNNTVAEKPIVAKKKGYKKALYLVLGLIGLSSVGYVVKDTLMPEPQCMQWQNDRYELLDCNLEVNGFIDAQLLPIDEAVVNLKSVKITDSTTFFKGGKAIVWYCKVNGVPECFDGPGFHPVTGKALRPITEYIIKKYFNN